MNITKIETNYKRKLYCQKTENILFSQCIKNIENKVLNVYPYISFQSIIGFGGALTESACFSIYNSPLSQAILDDCFSNNGLNYSICRLHIGSSDFSLNSYSYLEDTNIENFNIKRDEKYIIPIIKQAQTRNMGLKLLASPWSPPAFMKDNKSLYNGGKLLNNYKNLWAYYVCSYLKAYNQKEINIEYLTLQNEPNASQVWESCRYTAEEESDLLNNYIYPALKKNHIKTNIIIWDHNKEKLFTRTESMFKNSETYKNASGIAFHWYTGDHFENIELLNKLYPNKLLFHTEGCTGYSKFRQKDEIHNAEIYRT